MKKKYIAACLAAVMCLTGCGVDIKPPDEYIKPPAVASTKPNDELALATCTYEIQSGEVGQIKMVTPNGVAKVYNKPDTIVSTDDITIKVGQVPYLEEYRGYNFSQLEDINILAESVKTITGGIPWELRSLSDTEAVFKASVDDNQFMVGVSRANKSTLFVQFVRYANSVDKSKADMLRSMIDQTFSQRVFVKVDSESGEVVESDIQNPNDGVPLMYLPFGKSGYDVFLKGSSLVTKTETGYDVWINRGVVASIEFFKTGHTDLNITRYNTQLVEFQKNLIPGFKDLEFFKVTDVPSSFMDINHGFSCKIPFIYDKSEKHIDVFLIAVPDGFYTITVHSNKGISDKFLKNDLKIIPESVRKTSGELASAPIALTVDSVGSDYILPIHLNKNALKDLASPSKDYLLDTLGEARVSGSFVNKQLYYKDNFVYTFLPISSEMSTEQGIASEAYSSVAAYGEEELPYAEDINLKYVMFSTESDDTFKGDNPLVLRELVGTTIGAAAEVVFKEYYGEMSRNNIIFSREKHWLADNVFQQEFTYRYDDDVTNLRWNRNGAIFVKYLGQDRYYGDNVWFAGILDWGNKADQSKLASYQQAFESTVKQVPVHDGK